MLRQACSLKQACARATGQAWASEERVPLGIGYNRSMKLSAPDLTHAAPRSPFEQLDGIMLLPRAIDKARAQLAGTLGTYVYFDCPVNQMLFDALDVGENDFLEAVRVASSDDHVLVWIHERVGPDPAKIAEMNHRVQHDSKLDDIDKEEGRE